MSRSQPEFITVEIINWRRFNPRTDVKNASWFRIDHSLLDDTDFASFSHSELIAWIYMLCCASKKNSPIIRISYEHAQRVSRLTHDHVDRAIQKLVNIQVISIHDTHTVRARDAYDTHTNATGRDGTVRDEISPNADASRQVIALVELEKIYRRYPRKLGKGRGMKTATSQIKTQADLASLSQAVERFCAYHRKRETAPEFIPHFSTFMTNWRDWLDPTTGQTALPALPLGADPKANEEFEANMAKARADLRRAKYGDLPEEDL